jgi:hypothetical protein
MKMNRFRGQFEKVFNRITFVKEKGVPARDIYN